MEGWSLSLWKLSKFSAAWILCVHCDVGDATLMLFLLTLRFLGAPLPFTAEERLPLHTQCWPCHAFGSSEHSVPICSPREFPR